MLVQKNLYSISANHRTHNKANPKSVMNMETLEFTIYPDGRVKEKVTGIVGSSCEEVTAAIEAELGVVISQEKTSEFYNQTASNSEKVSNQGSFSQW